MDPARTSSRQQHSYSAHPPSITDSHRVVTPQRNHSPHPHQSYPPPPPPPYQTNGHVISTSPVNNSPVDTRSQHNPPSASYPPHQQHPYSSAPPHPNHYQQQPPPSQGPAQPSRISTNDQSHQLPPYRENIKAETVHNLPGIRPSSRQELGRPQEYHIDQRNGTGHAPTPVDQRAYSQDSRTPLSPSRGPYSAGQAVDGSNTSGKMELHNSYPPQQPLAHHPSHHLPPPQHIQQHHHHQQPMGPPPPGPYMNTTPVMEHHPSHHYPVQPVYQQPNHGPATQMPATQTAGKKRPMRAQQACDQCRQRKQKCDEGDPCSFCRENNHQCHYRDTPPVKVDKNTQTIITQLEYLVKMANQTVLRDEFNNRLKDLEDRMQPYRQHANESRDVKDHRTGPHKLIKLWPSMYRLLQDTNTPVGEWVTSAEDRGIIRIYGKGEGIDETYSLISAVPSSPAQSEDGSESGRTPQEGLWGKGFATTPSSDTTRQISTSGGLRADGSLDLDRETIIDLYDHFCRHIHIMHPFLDRSRTRKLIEAFIQQNNPISRSKSAGFASEVTQPQKRSRTAENSWSARQTGVYGDGAEYLNRNPLSTERSPENAIVWLILALGKICKHTDPLPALVQDNRRGVNKNATNGSFAAFSPAHGTRPSPQSPKSTPVAQTTPSDNGMFAEPRSRRSSTDHGTPEVGRNIEKIPGLAYFAKAAEILGDHYDGSELTHAQMFLLAALYKGQLARVQESMSNLTIAGRICQGLIHKRKLYRPGTADTTAFTNQVTQVCKDRRNRLILTASWSCLQLESDILAEMSYPGSGITLMEQRICPLATDPQEEEGAQTNGARADQDHEQDNHAMSYYNFQLFLRQRLNDAHKNLYGDELSKENKEAVTATIVHYGNYLTYWRRELPAHLQWNDSDPASDNILAARLRAKYYGAKYVMYRPYLDYAMHIMDSFRQGRPVHEVAVDASGIPRSLTEIWIFEAISGFDPEVIMDNAKQCIQAALLSTVAFDNVPTMPNRLIVTNIHGTAHAQFGNMLVLAAAYNNELMRPHVNKEDFQNKLKRTIEFLGRLAPISPTCKLDCNILNEVQRKLFSADSKSAANSDTGPPSANTSFTT